LLIAVGERDISSVDGETQGEEVKFISQQLCEMRMTESRSGGDHNNEKVFTKSLAVTFILCGLRSQDQSFSSPPKIDFVGN